MAAGKMGEYMPPSGNFVPLYHNITGRGDQAEDYDGNPDTFPSPTLVPSTSVSPDPPGSTMRMKDNHFQKHR
jgi:hypothetical protein